MDTLTLNVLSQKIPNDKVPTLTNVFEGLGPPNINFVKQF